MSITQLSVYSYCLVVPLGTAHAKTRFKKLLSEQSESIFDEPLLEDIFFNAASCIDDEDLNVYPCGSSQKSFSIKKVSGNIRKSCLLELIAGNQNDRFGSNYF